MFSHLHRFGYSVVDGAFGDEWCSRFQAEIRELYQHHLMMPNQTHFMSKRRDTGKGKMAAAKDHEGQTSAASASASASEAANEFSLKLLEKKGIHEMEADYPGLEGIIPSFTSLLHDHTLIDSFNSHASALASSSVSSSSSLPALRLASQSMKLQYNSGEGSCFPLHSDSDLSIDSRQLTCLVYLNRDWAPKDGGELVLYPLPWEAVTIEPRWDRMVLFESSGMVHRVRPSWAKERTCFTIWCKAEGLPQAVRARAERRALSHLDILRSSASPSLTPSLISSLHSLFHPRVRLHTSKFLLQSEWRQSILDSHPPSAERDEALEQFEEEVTKIGLVLDKWLKEAERAGVKLPLKLPKEAWGGEAQAHAADGTNEKSTAAASLDWSRIAGWF